MSTRRRALVVLGLLAGAVVLPAPAQPGSVDEEPEARVRTSCSSGARAELRVRADDGALRVELRIETRRTARWSVIVLHERRIAFRGVVPATRSSGLRLRRTLPDLYGRDRIVVRASGPRRETCRLTATL